MFALLTGTWRRRAATMLVAVYALCVVAPVAAFAMMDIGKAAHCLTESHAAAGTSHDYQHSAANNAAIPADDDHGSPKECCGLFSIMAIAPAVEAVSTPIAHASAVAPRIPLSLTGHDAGRIDRPPRFLPSL